MQKKSLFLLSYIVLWVVSIVSLTYAFINNNSSSSSQSNASSHIRVAYFSLDSLEKNYNYLQSLRRTFETKQTTLQDKLIAQEQSFQVKVRQFQEQLPLLTQEQAEQKQRELYQDRQNFERQKIITQKKLIEDERMYAQKVQQSIEDYIKQHKEDYPYDFVFAAQPGLLFYKHPTHDITAQLLADLNKHDNSND